MRQDFTDITLVLDRSGSMRPIADATIEAVNGYVDSQKGGVGTANLTLAQFDDQYEIVHNNVAIGIVPPLTRLTYEPRGSTALLDAIGRTIIATGKRLSDMPDADRPGVVLFVIQTDGYENASREFTAQKVSEMIAEQRDKYAWQFVFLGANQDAIASAAQLGIHGAQAVTYNATASGTKGAFAGVARSSHKLRTARASGQSQASYQATEQDRKEALGK